MSGVEKQPLECNALQCDIGQDLCLGSLCPKTFFLNQIGGETHDQDQFLIAHQSNSTVSSYPNHLSKVDYEKVKQVVVQHYLGFKILVA